MRHWRQRWEATQVVGLGAVTEGGRGGVQSDGGHLSSSRTRGGNSNVGLMLLLELR